MLETLGNTAAPWFWAQHSCEVGAGFGIPEWCSEQGWEGDGFAAGGGWRGVFANASAPLKSSKNVTSLSEPMLMSPLDTRGAKKSL